MKGTFRLAVPDRAKVRMQFEMTIGEAKVIKERLSTLDWKSSRHPLDVLLEVLRNCINAAEGSFDISSTEKEVDC